MVLGNRYQRRCVGVNKKNSWLGYFPMLSLSEFQKITVILNSKIREKQCTRRNKPIVLRNLAAKKQRRSLSQRQYAGAPLCMAPCRKLIKIYNMPTIPDEI